MITFKKILLEFRESGRRSPFDVEPVEDSVATGLIDFMHKNCKEFLATIGTGKFVYRGTGFDKNPRLYWVQDPTEGDPRDVEYDDYSANLPYIQETAWAYDYLISHYWGYPAREWCIIGSGNHFIAKQYGRLNIMVPFDGAKFGVVPSEDMWNTDLFLQINKCISNSSSISYEDSDDHDGYDDEPLTERDVESIIDEVANHFMPPEKFGFKLLTYPQLVPILNSQEVWTCDKCLMIEHNLFTTKVLPLLQ